MKLTLFLIKFIKTYFLFTANDHMQANTVCRKAGSNYASLKHIFF